MAIKINPFLFIRENPEMHKVFVSFICFYFFCACGNGEQSTSSSDRMLVFSVMGDVPRSTSEDTLLQKQIAGHNKYSQSEFMLHVGDIKSGSAPCDEGVFIKVSGYLKALHVPTFIVPGDNEWNDCLNPAEAWSLWKKYFLKFEDNWDTHPPVEHQQEFEENFAWISKGVLLIGINLVGGRVHDQDIWNKMLNNSAQWIDEQLREKKNAVKAAVIFAQAKPKEKHTLFMDTFIKSAKHFAKPVLFVHGDGHVWLYDNPWLAPNLVRIQVDRGGIALPLEIRVNFDTDSTFQFNRNPFPVIDQ
jgi:hypothetical protein